MHNKTQLISEDNFNKINRQKNKLTFGYGREFSKQSNTDIPAEIILTIHAYSLYVKAKKIACLLTRHDADRKKYLIFLQQPKDSETVNQLNVFLGKTDHDWASASREQKSFDFVRAYDLNDGIMEQLLLQFNTIILSQRYATPHHPPSLKDRWSNAPELYVQDDDVTLPSITR